MEEHDQSLQAGSHVDRYQIKEILGAGGFGVVYKAWDEKLQRFVVLKEYLPEDCAARKADGVTVIPRTNRSDNYRYGLDSFLDEARRLVTLKHNNIVSALDFVEDNGTAYLVMDYAEGETLDDYLKRIRFQGGMPESEILSIIQPILRGLVAVHKHGLLHRDIKPGNIYLRRDEEPMLIDFGAARYALGEHSKSISAIISMGYAPPEQYTSRGKQGPFTDLYAIGACLYQLITGKQPIDSPDRREALANDEPDPLSTASRSGQGRYSPLLLQITDWCLQLNSKKRPQQAQDLLDAWGKGHIAGAEADKATEPKPSQHSRDGTRKVDEQERFQDSQKKANTSHRKGTASDSSSSGFKLLTAAIVLLLAGAAGFGGYKLASMDEPDTPHVAVNSGSNLANTSQDSHSTPVNHKQQGLGKPKERDPAELDMRLTGDRIRWQKGAPFPQSRLIELQRLSVNGNASAMAILANYYSRNRDYRDEKEAFRLAKISAETGNMWGQIAYARMLIKGIGTQKKHSEALQWLKPAARAGDNEALDYQADIYDDEDSAFFNRQKANQIYQRLANEGYASGQVSLGYAYDKGLGLKKSSRKAFEWYEAAARQDYPIGLYNVGVFYSRGYYVQKSYERSVEYYRKAAALEYPGAISNLAYMYREGKGVTQSNKKAFELYLKAARHGHDNAQSSLGYAYEKGRGVKKDLTQANYWYRKAAEQGYAHGQTNLGINYKDGIGLEKSAKKAKEWFEKAAAQNYARAQNELGSMYFSGNGVSRSYDKALQWYRKAADQGDAFGQVNVGIMYETGRGVSKSLVTAVTWYRKAAEQNHAGGQYNLADMYENGKGVGRDRQQAIKYYRLAAAQNHSKSKSALNRLGVSL